MSRLYRDDMNRDRFRFFRAVHYESDLLVGVPHQLYQNEMGKSVEKELFRLRKILLAYSERDPGFLSSLVPLDLILPPSDRGEDEAEEVRIMLDCGVRAGTGPMASVAGLFAQEVGRMLIKTFGAMEVVVENGGDLYLRNESELLSVIHAGSSSLSDRMAFVIPGGEWGICTSSGTLGHSFSEGKADAVTVIADSAPLSDAWATALANQVQSAADMEGVLEQVAGISEIKGCAVLVENQVGIRGEIEVKLLSSDA